jgi:hypothetical protein
MSAPDEVYDLAAAKIRAQGINLTNRDLAAMAIGADVAWDAAQSCPCGSPIEDHYSWQKQHGYTQEQVDAAWEDGAVL